MEQDWNPVEAYQNADVANSYDTARFSTISGRLGDRKEKKAFTTLLDHITPNLKSALDVPCGTGRMTEILLRKGYHVTAADISLEMMAKARQKLEPFSNRILFCFI